MTSTRNICFIYSRSSSTHLKLLKLFSIYVSPQVRTMPKHDDTSWIMSCPLLSNAAILVEWLAHCYCWLPQLLVTLLHQRQGEYTPVGLIGSGLDKSNWVLEASWSDKALPALEPGCIVSVNDITGSWSHMRLTGSWAGIAPHKEDNWVTTFI